jgi:hypothetical protein
MTSEMAPDPSSRRRTDNLIEWLAAILLALVTLVTAWCGYQSSQRGAATSRRSGTASNRSLSARQSPAGIESSRRENLANQRRAVHVGLFIEYAAAFSAATRSWRPSCSRVSRGN